MQKWVTVLQKTALVPPAGHRLAGCNQSNQWPMHLVQILTRLGAGVHQLRNLDAVFNGVLDGVEVSRSAFAPSVSATASDCCQKEIAAWRKRIEDAIAKIPKFSSFL